MGVTTISCQKVYYIKSCHCVDINMHSYARHSYARHSYAHHPYVRHACARMYKYMVLLSPIEVFRAAQLASRVFRVDDSENHMVRVRSRSLRSDFGDISLVLPSGRKDGPNTGITAAGRPALSVFYVNGVNHGISYIYTVDGHMLAYMYMRNGLRDGLEVSLCSTTLQKAVQYMNMGGVRHGEYFTWYQNGTMSRRGEYTNNVKTGVHQAWYSDGRLRKHTVYT